MIKIATHIGALIGDARSPGRHWVKLWQTKMHWVTNGQDVNGHPIDRVAAGEKYNKLTGVLAGSYPFPPYELDLGSIRPLDAEPTDRRDKS